MIAQLNRDGGFILCMWIPICSSSLGADVHEGSLLFVVALGLSDASIRGGSFLLLVDDPRGGRAFTVLGSKVGLDDVHLGVNVGEITTFTSRVNLALSSLACVG